MFYTNLLVGKCGILSKIWMAAHWEKKLTKAHIYDCNLESAIQRILNPMDVIALRTSGHLLLGIVRIYHRKAKYLLADCNEALLGINITFRPGVLDLSAKKGEASYNAITLPEDLSDFDMPLPDLNLINVAEHFTLNQSRIEEITIQEEHSRHESFDELDAFRHGSGGDVSFEVSAHSFLPGQSFAFLPGDPFKEDFFGDEGASTDFFAYLDETQESSIENLPVANTTTLVSDEEIAFVLAPIDISEIKKKKRPKRKRRLLVDNVKEIPRWQMQELLADTSDIVTTFALAPPTLQLMELKQIGSVQWLLSHPSQPINNAELLELFTSNNKVDTRRKVETQPDQAANKRPGQEQQEIDLSQQDAAQLTEVSSSIAEEPLQTELDLNDNHHPASDKDSSVPEEPTPNVQNNDEQQWNKRTQTALNGLRKLNQDGVSSFTFQNLCKNQKRKQVSTKFYSFLMLQNQSAIKMTQSAPYGDITVSPGPRFHSL
ncbi:double-strand-break repair protein rad21-like protein 1 isoform X2 [Dendropsophus ebraccatus]|uniref:double-strand-break repair protein rad21-like protein 1 isoform X2 n=1 Tax=Dendropsophus ebraccatus TaxID=150705 RepID=UPI00383133E9